MIKKILCICGAIAFILLCRQARAEVVPDKQIAEWLVRADTTWSVQIIKEETTASRVLIYVDGVAHKDHEKTKTLLFTWIKDGMPDRKPVLLPVAGEMVNYKELWVQGISQDKRKKVKMVVRYKLDPKQVYTFGKDEDHKMSQNGKTDDGKRFDVLASLNELVNILSSLFDSGTQKTNSGPATVTNAAVVTSAATSTFLTQNMKAHTK